MKGRAGFSLVEVLVALVIIAIMGGVVAVNLFDTAEQARITATQTQIDQLAQALTLYKVDNGQLPSQTQGLEALIRQPATPPVPKNYRQGGYLSGTLNVPLDGWDNPFVYLVPGRENQPFEIISYGADGMEGGTGADADLTNLK